METCKKCGKSLPDSYKRKNCENCAGKKAQTLKSVGKSALSIALLVGGTAIAIVTKGKIDPPKS